MPRVEPKEKLLQDVKNGLLKEVRVDTLDGLGRNTEKILQTLRYLHDHKVGVHKGERELPYLLQQCLQIHQYVCPEN
jgi:hypothetical protein